MVYHNYRNEFWKISGVYKQVHNQQIALILDTQKHLHMFWLLSTAIFSKCECLKRYAALLCSLSIVNGEI